MKSKKVVSIILLVGIMVISVFILTGCGKKKVNLNDFFEYEVVGVDGYARVEYRFNRLDFEDNVFELLGFSTYNIGDISVEDLEKLETIAADLAGVGGAWDKESGISNGDSITYKWTFKGNSLEELEKKFGIKLIYEDINLNVEGLEAAVEFDPFEDLQVSTYGISPAGEITVTSNKYPNIIFAVEKNSGLSNGDKVTITAGFLGSEEELIASYGGPMTRTSMEYTVEGLDEYITSVADIPEDLKASMLKEMEIIAKY